MTTITDMTVRAADGTTISLDQWRGKVLLIVNTASKCGFTPQFEGLQTLQDSYSAKGFTVLGFPSDQFNQELDADDEIGSFCQKNYGVSFPMFSKVKVNGDDAHPVYRWLRSEKKGLTGGKIRWNFTKYLVGRDGKVLSRYAPTTKPEKIAGDIEKALAS